MSSSNDYASATREAIRQAIAPLETVVQDLTREIETREGELADMRQNRMAALKMLRLADPVAAARYGGKPGPKRTQPPDSGWANKSGTALKLGQWLEANPTRFPEGFHARGLYDIREEIGIDRALPSFNAYLFGLQELGVIRLDRVAGKTNQKVYRLATQ
jgi:hypothetical protein